MSKITVNFVFNRNPYMKLDLELDMLIKDVKTLLFSKVSPKLDTKNIKLYKNTRELDDNEALRKYNINNESKIDLVFMQSS